MLDAACTWHPPQIVATMSLTDWTNVGKRIFVSLNLAATFEPSINITNLQPRNNRFHAAITVFPHDHTAMVSTQCPSSHDPSFPHSSFASCALSSGGGYCRCLVKEMIGGWKGKQKKEDEKWQIENIYYNKLQHTSSKTDKDDRILQEYKIPGLWRLSSPHLKGITPSEDVLCSGGEVNLQLR